ncbi:hypothetical protein [Roseateles noduli]|uniref:hypothetical protein n=1 Tax=Roseateles noduli TaxID=2052484 RepID=UPI003D661C53
MAMDLAPQGFMHTAKSRPLCTMQKLVEAFRHPPLIFGTASPPGLEADHEARDWSLATQDIQCILDIRQVSPETLLSKLEATARFIQLHELRLCGNPWLHVMRFQNIASVSYVIHLDLDQEDANTWNERFHSMLASQDLLDLPLYINLRERGPSR